MIVYIHEVKASIWEAIDLNQQITIDRAVRSLFDVSAENEVSFYRSRSDRKTELIAVALCANRDSLKTFQYIEVFDEDFGAVGAIKTRSPGNRPVWAVNRWHFDVDLSGGKAERLVRRVGGRARPRVKSIYKAELKSRARKLWRWLQHRIPRDDRLLRKT